MATVRTALVDLHQDAPRINTSFVTLLPTPAAPAKVVTARVELAVIPDPYSFVAIGGQWVGVTEIKYARGGSWA